MKTQLPHTTKNTALAVTAFLLRIPVARRRVYTQEFLESQHLTGKQARARGILGDCYYGIPKDDPDHPDAPAVIEAFNAEKLAIEEGANTTEIDVPPEVVARIACRVLHARKSFFRDLLTLTPFLRIPCEGQPRTTPAAADGSYTTTVPGFKDIRLDADEQTRNHLA